MALIFSAIDPSACSSGVSHPTASAGHPLVALNHLGNVVALQLGLIKALGGQGCNLRVHAVLHLQHVRLGHTTPKQPLKQRHLPSVEAKQ